MSEKSALVAVILPDASPLISLERIGRLDLLDLFTVPVRIVDQVHYEATKPQNDPGGRIAAWLRSRGDQIEIIETAFGLGFQVRLQRGDTPSTIASDMAVAEYASVLAQTLPPDFAALVLFEDPGILDTRLARIKGVHLINTASWIRALGAKKIIKDASDILKKINAVRNLAAETG